MYDALLPQSNRPDPVVSHELIVAADPGIEQPQQVEYHQRLLAAERRATEETLLEAVRTVLAREMDLTLVFRTIVESIAHTFGYRHVSLFLIEDEQLVLQHQVGYHQVLNYIPLTTGIMGRVARTGEAVLLEAGQFDPDVVWPFRELVAEVCVPLHDEGEVVGVLNLECTREIALGPADLRLMSALSEHVGIALTRARLYRAVHDSEAKYRTVIEQVKEVIFQVDTEGRWVLLNPAWTDITGFAVAGSLGSAWEQHVHPDDRSHTLAAFQALLTCTIETRRFETRFRTAAGSWRYLEVYARAIVDANGRGYGAAGTLNDITDRKRAETELRRQNEYLAVLHATTLALMNRLDVADLLAEIITWAGQIVGTEHGFISLVDAAGATLELKVGTGNFNDVSQQRLGLGEGMAGMVWQSRQPLVVPEYDVWSGRTSHIRPNRFHAVVVVPLLLRQQVMGVLGLARIEPGQSFDADEVDLLIRLAQLATIALDNAQLYSIAQQELAERKRAEQQVQQVNAQLKTHLVAVQQHSQELRRLNELHELLQECLSVQEAYTLSATVLQQLLPATSGMLAVIVPDQSHVHSVASWGNPQTALVFAPAQCWALRLRRVHGLRDDHADARCQHLSGPLPEHAICVPLMARGTLLGVLHLQPYGAASLNDAQAGLAQTAGSTIALVLANLDLQQTLREQATRDVLTGLFNRRYLEDALEREVRKAHRSGEPVAVLVVDVDHFKQVNDTYGHAAGDTLLRELGGMLQAQIRGEDLACRYGGEEFAMILPGAVAEVAQQRAEQLRMGIKQLTVQHEGQRLGTITISVGVAVLTGSAANSARLVREADAALYAAKHAGRDCVVLLEPLA
ncbi:MAG: diguanylate cyclase [Herpetosiphonaceae bacterium]|nr:diguanylate cyclase [Herpetosiphonaceae bacterium]